MFAIPLWSKYDLLWYSEDAFFMHLTFLIPFWVNINFWDDFNLSGLTSNLFNYKWSSLRYFCCFSSSLSLVLKHLHVGLKDFTTKHFIVGWINFFKKMRNQTVSLPTWEVSKLSKFTWIALCNKKISMQN